MRLSLLRHCEALKISVDVLQRLFLVFKEFAQFAGHYIKNWVVECGKRTEAYENYGQ